MIDIVIFKFISFVEDDPKMINYMPFPRTNPPEKLQAPFSKIMPITPEQVSKGIAEAEVSSSGIDYSQLIDALRDLQAYMVRKYF